MTYLLHTKTIVPPVSSRHTSRHRLVQQIDTARDARLVLVSAPAGSGKTSCLAEWAHAARQAGTHVGWYALDAQDNDPARFAAYLCQAFAVASPAFDAPDQPGDLEGTAAVILNTVIQQGAPHALVLDDYHLITNPQIHHTISMMSEHLPPNMRIALGTRADPPLQLARLRARGEIAEVRMRDLRFSPPEIAHLLEVSIGRAVSPAMLARLEAATEGWAAALALILMSLSTEASSLSEQVLDRHLAAYSQTQQHVFDYFAAEVLHQQPAEVQQFLLDTCVLDRLRPDICRALTRRDDAAAMLARLAHSSLFVIPLSDDQPVYRYHHLFEGFLRQRLQLDDPDRYREQHYAASRWLAGQGYTPDAVRHALEAQRYHDAASLIADTAWETLTARGEIMTVLGWLPHFPADTLARHPRLCLYFSRAFYLTGDVGQSQVYLQMAAEALAGRPEAQAGERGLRTIVANYQATLAGYRGEVSRGMALNAQAEASRDTLVGVDRVRIANTTAHLHFLRGDVPAAQAAYEAALQEARAIDHHYLALDAQYYLARLDLMAGDLRQARARCESAMGLAAREMPARIAPLSTVMLPLAVVHYEQDDLAGAERLLREAIALAQRGSIPDALWLACTLLALVLASRSQAGEAAALLEQARQIAEPFHSPPICSFIGAAEARAALHTGDLEAAAGWAAGYDPGAEVEYQRDYENLTLARVWLAHGEPEHALPLLDAVWSEAARMGRHGHAAEAALLRALALQAAGQPDDAPGALGPVLALARREGYTRLLLDAGRPVRELLRLAVERGIEADYASALLAIDRQPGRALHPADALTEREIEVLQAIADGASNQEIADALFISVGTVKSHIHRLMSKLDARNRTDAVARARGLNILKR